MGAPLGVTGVSHRACPLIVLSVDGLRPELALSPDEFGLRVPNLRQLVASGTCAAKVVSVCPTTTYPAHATLVTGVPPRVHGVYSHLASRDPTERARPWNWFASTIRVPTLWDAARAAGLKTAAVTWPVSAGAAIDYNLPEIWNPAVPDPNQDFETIARYSAPAGLFGQLLEVLQPLLSKGADETKANSSNVLGANNKQESAAYTGTIEVVSNVQEPSGPGRIQLQVQQVLTACALRPRCTCGGNIVRIFCLFTLWATTRRPTVSGLFRHRVCRRSRPATRKLAAFWQP